MRRLLTLLRLTALVGLVAAPPAVHAGAQVYEPLSASVRTAMSRSISDRGVPQLSFKHPEDGYRWLLAMSDRLAKRIPDAAFRIELLKTVHYEATRAGLDPQLVLGLMHVESGFKKYAVSKAGARGLMQVMPFWVGLLGESDHNLFHLRTNIRYGCVILRHYLDVEKGDLYRALGRYNGSVGKPEYPNQVLAAWRGTFKYEGPVALPAGARVRQPSARTGAEGSGSPDFGEREGMWLLAS